MGYTVIMHSFKGTTWKKHKYIRKEKDKYIYPNNRSMTSEEYSSWAHGQYEEMSERDQIQAWLDYVNDLLKDPAGTMSKVEKEPYRPHARPRPDSMDMEYIEPNPNGSHVIVFEADSGITGSYPSGFGNDLLDYFPPKVAKGMKVSDIKVGHDETRFIEEHGNVKIR